MALDFEALRSALVAVSAFDAQPKSQVSPELEAQIRKLHGGRLVPLPSSETRWYLEDVETATHQANAGMVATACRLWEACRGAGAFAGVLSTRTEGMVRLPKLFRGNADIVRDLSSVDGKPRSVFDEIFPPSELALLVGDGVGLGFGFGELVPVQGREFPVFQRYDPQFLRYKAHENAWFYRSLAGELPIIPGNGRWILHTPGGRVAPWVNGIWKAVSRAFIRMEHANLYDSNWMSKLANPARVATAPNIATEEQSQEWWEDAMAWGVNTTILARPGYDLKLLESNGRGSDAFDRAIQRAEREGIIAIAGQAVTVDGGSGFQNNEIFSTIRSDLIQSSAMALAYTINTQGLPAYVAGKYGLEALKDMAIVGWDTTPPDELKRTAEVIGTLGDSIITANRALEETGQMLDPAQLYRDRGLSVIPRPEGSAPVTKLDLAPTDIAKVVTVNEVRRSQGLPPMLDGRGDLTVLELANSLIADEAGVDDVNE